MQWSCQLIIVVQIWIHFFQCVTHWLFGVGQLRWDHSEHVVLIKVLLIKKWLHIIVNYIFCVLLKIEVGNLMNGFLFMNFMLVLFKWICNFLMHVIKTKILQVNMVWIFNTWTCGDQEYTFIIHFLFKSHTNFQLLSVVIPCWDRNLLMLIFNADKEIFMIVKISYPSFAAALWDDFHRINWLLTFIVKDLYVI